MEDITYDVRVYKTEICKNKNSTSYVVRWKCGPMPLWRETFHNAAQTEIFRSKLNSAAKDGKAFSIETGRPVEWERDKPEEQGRRDRIRWGADSADKRSHGPGE